MGKVVDPKCRSCGHEWQGEILGGLMSTGFYRCNRCGSVGEVGRDELIQSGLIEKRSPWDLNREEAATILGRCQCGGTFSKSAPVRCPECRSKDIDLDRGPGLMVD